MHPGQDSDPTPARGSGLPLFVSLDPDPIAELKADPIRTRSNSIWIQKLIVHSIKLFLGFIFSLVL